MRFGRHRGIALRRGHQGLLHVWGSPSDHMPRFRDTLQVWREADAGAAVNLWWVTQESILSARVGEITECVKPQHVELCFTSRACVKVQRRPNCLFRIRYRRYERPLPRVYTSDEYSSDVRSQETSTRQSRCSYRVAAPIIVLALGLYNFGVAACRG